jgi:antitoxin (DNA-binding transcriptional repressor) of toxin-antitoxin stability system
MTLVSVDEARDRLQELIGRMAAGEQVVITDGGRWVAALATPPPMPPTPEEQAAARAAREQAVEDMLRWRIQEGLAIPEGMTFQQLLDKALGRS